MEDFKHTCFLAMALGCHIQHVSPATKQNQTTETSKAEEDIVSCLNCIYVVVSLLHLSKNQRKNEEHTNYWLIWLTEQQDLTCNNPLPQPITFVICYKPDSSFLLFHHLFCSIWCQYICLNYFTVTVNRTHSLLLWYNGSLSSVTEK